MLPALLGQRLLWWLAGQALPARPVLAHRIRQATWGVLCAVTAGVLFGALILAVVAGAYVLMISEGISPFSAFLGLFGVVLVVGCLFLLRAQQYAVASASCKDDLRLFPRESAGQMEAGLSGMVAAFMDGLMQPPAPSPEPSRPRRGHVRPYPVELQSDGLTEQDLAGSIGRPILHPDPASRSTH